MSTATASDFHFITAEEVAEVSTWEGLLDDLREAHHGPRPQEGSMFVGDAENGLFNRGVILPGHGSGVKVSTIFPANTQRSPALPSEHSTIIVFAEDTKAVEAFCDGPSITTRKTAADSALASDHLSREDSETLLVAGAGPVAAALTQAHLHVRPSLRRVLLYNRSPEKLQGRYQALRDQGLGAEIVADLDEAVSRADIISTATGAQDPLIHAECVQPGTHVDLVGGFRPDMQEAEASLMGRSRVFVDDSEAAWGSGDLIRARDAGHLEDTDVEADLFELVQREDIDRAQDDITVFKNAGAAYLDLLVTRHMMKRLDPADAAA